MTKHNFVLFCKTYKGDFERFKILKESIDKFNVDNIPFYVVCPEKDLELFLSLKNNDENYEYNILTDESVLEKVNSNSNEQSWYSQQVVKLYFYKLNLCNHYLILDSDCYFIRNFSVSDFMYDNETPYLPIGEMFKGEFNLMQLFKKTLLKNHKNWDRFTYQVKDILNRKGKKICIMIPLVFSVSVLEAMDKDLLNNGGDFSILIEKSPFEMQWYAEYILKTNIIKIFPTPTFFCMITFQGLYQLYRFLGWNEKLFSEHYVGLLMNSGWVKDKKFKPSIFGKLFKFFMNIYFKKTSKKRLYDK